MSYLSGKSLYGSRTRSHRTLGWGMNMPMHMDIDISQFAQCGGAVVFLVVLSFDLSIIPVFFLTDDSAI